MGKGNAAIAMVDDQKWKAERDLDLYLSFLEMKKDPKRMAAVKKLAKDKLAGIASAATDGDNDGDSKGKDTDKDGM